MLLVLSLLACAEADCTTESGATYASGESWTCDDGCNTCACEDGAIASTLMACEAVTCTDATGTYDVGATWTCEDGCNTCACLEDGSIESTDMDCTAG